MAGGFATLLVLIVVLSGSVIWIASAQQEALDAATLATQEKQKALDAATLASQEKQKAISAAQDSRYESLAQILLRILWTPHQRGWSEVARKTTDEMAGIREDARVRSFAIAARRGYDAHVTDFISPGGSSLLFDPSGRRLLIASVSNESYGGTDRGSTVWDVGAKTQHVTKIRGNGPVAFRPDGKPLQLAYDDPGTLRLWDVARERVICEFTIPTTAKAGPEPAYHTGLIPYDRAPAADGSRVAASIKDPEGRPWVFVWDGVSGRLIHLLRPACPATDLLARQQPSGRRR